MLVRCETKGMFFNYRLFLSQIGKSLFAAKGTHLRLSASRMRFLIYFLVLFPLLWLSTMAGFLLDRLFFWQFKKQPVDQPVFILGNFRSGTTLLQRLLARDRKNFTVIRSWEIYTSPSWTELEEALFVELQYVEEHLFDYPAYCILNLCRLVYSFETGDVVVSKTSSAAWAAGALPEWSGLLESAQKSYAGRATSTDESVMLEGVEDLHRIACRRIEQSRAVRETRNTGSTLETEA